VRFERVEELERALPLDTFTREPVPWEAGFLAGKSFISHRARGGARTAPLTDFYIGAHAAVRGHRLLTRDRRRYATYFPKLELLAP
jgi:predicted nucleic acid-binding protein